MRKPNRRRQEWPTCVDGYVAQGRIDRIRDDSPHDPIWPVIGVDHGVGNRRPLHLGGLLDSQVGVGFVEPDLSGAGGYLISDRIPEIIHTDKSIQCAIPVQVPQSDI